MQETFGLTVVRGMGSEEDGLIRLVEGEGGVGVGVGVGAFPKATHYGDYFHVETKADPSNLVGNLIKIVVSSTLKNSFSGCIKNRNVVIFSHCNDIAVITTGNVCFVIKGFKEIQKCIQQNRHFPL